MTAVQIAATAPKLLIPPRACGNITDTIKVVKKEK
jgi:hypothetical protein